MPIIRSIFWLSLAFMVIGPQIDYSGAIANTANQVSDSGQKIYDEHTNFSACTALDCVGQKLAVTAGINAIRELGRSANVGATYSPPLTLPFPHPRLARSS